MSQNTLDSRIALTLYLHDTAGESKVIHDTVSRIAKAARAKTGGTFSTDTVRTYLRKLGIRFIENKQNARTPNKSYLQAHALRHVQFQLHELANLVYAVTVELAVTNNAIIDPLKALCRRGDDTGDKEEAE